MYRGYALIAPMACTGAMWRMLRVGRILICVHTTNKDCLLLLLSSGTTLALSAQT